MKKFVSMLALGSMLFGLSACSSEEPAAEDSKSTVGCVYIKLENIVTPGSRMIADAKTESDVTEFRHGFIIFGTPKSAIRKHYEIVTNAEDASKSDHAVLIDELRRGKTFEGIPGDVTNVAIVANVTDDELSAEEFHNGTIRFHTDVLNHVIQLRNQYEDNMSHVALYDMKQLTQGSAAGSMSATLELKPLCARLEIAKITPGPNVLEYQIDGIYLAGFYKQMNISGISNREFWVGPDYDTEDPETALTNFYTSYPYLMDNKIRAVEETKTDDSGSVTYTAFYPEGEDGKVWAYPFFGKSPMRDDNEHYGLRLLVKVSHLKVRMKDENGDMQTVDVTAKDQAAGVKNPGIRYLNINGFVKESHNTQAEPVQFYNGYVYQVQDFEITTQNLSDKIMPNDIDVNLTVTVKPWVIQKVYPQI